MRKTLTILATCLALPVSAGTFGPFDDVFLFGDSLSDSGNLSLAAPTAVPNPPYLLGQFTNGNSWATQLGLAPSLLGGTNFAFGGARAVENGDFIPDLLTQIGSFTSTVGAISGNPLGVIFIGGNDFLDYTRLEDPTRDDKKSLIRGVAKTVRKGVRSLTKAGVSDVVVFGLPDFGTLPQFRDDTDAADDASRVSARLNAALERSAKRLNKKIDQARVGFFDLDDFLSDVLAAIPEDNRSVRCLETGPGCFANSDQYVFYDDIHPTAWVHTALANEFREEVLQPVPLPAGAMLLLTGVAGFALWGKRRKSLA